MATGRSSLPWILVATALLPLQASDVFAAGTAKTLVTFSFDDSLDSHADAARILEAHGLRATFFVNSGRVGLPGYLDWDDLRRMAEAGHEVGGHTIDHTHLFSDGPAEKRRQICEDRAALVAQGLAPVSFSYPYAEHGPEEARILTECGYLFGRAEGGIAELDEEDDRPVAEAIPPANRLMLRTRPGVTREWSVEDLQAYVERTEKAGGGWMNFTFHDLLPSCGAKNYCMAPEDLEAFVAWIAQRRALGTEVVTVAQAFTPTLVDRRSPKIALSAPGGPDAVLADTYELRALASDDVAVDRVYFIAGYRIVARANAWPWVASWDTRSMENGTYELRAIAVDRSGRIGVAPVRMIRVDNEVEAAPLFRRKPTRAIAPPAVRQRQPQ
jgi:peptidoglycan/xylan/chitin deacetylase (PgdA/CDA1 family)